MIDNLPGGRNSEKGSQISFAVGKTASKHKTVIRLDEFRTDTPAGVSVDQPVQEMRKKQTPGWDGYGAAGTDGPETTPFHPSTFSKIDVQASPAAHPAGMTLAVFLCLFRQGLPVAMPRVIMKNMAPFAALLSASSTLTDVALSFIPFLFNCPICIVLLHSFFKN